MNWGHDVIYPNTFIVLVGPSGQSRKGVAVSIGRFFMEEVGVQIVSQSITREALIEAMKENNLSFLSESSGQVQIHSSMICVCPELSVFLGQSDIGFLADLTDWYDSHESWTYQTRMHGPETISRMCLSLLGATAPDWLPSILPKEAVGGGWTSRVMFIVEENKGKIIPNPNLIGVNMELENKLVDDLMSILNMSGEFVFDEKALKLYEDWYNGYEQQWKKGRPPIPDPRFRGYLSRRATHIKKVSMALSASRSDDLIISVGDFTRARKLMEQAEKKMPAAFIGLGEDRLALITEKIMAYIESEKKTTRSRVLQLFYRDCSAWTLEQIENTMQRTHVVKISANPSDQDKTYEWIA